MHRLILCSRNIFYSSLKLMGKTKAGPNLWQVVYQQGVAVVQRFLAGKNGSTLRFWPQAFAIMRLSDCQLELCDTLSTFPLWKSHWMS